MTWWPCLWRRILCLKTAHNFTLQKQHWLLTLFISLASFIGISSLIIYYWMLGYGLHIRVFALFIYIYYFLKDKFILIFSFLFLLLYHAIILLFYDSYFWFENLFAWLRLWNILSYDQNLIWMRNFVKLVSYCKFGKVYDNLFLLQILMFYKKKITKLGNNFE